MRKRATFTRRATRRGGAWPIRADSEGCPGAGGGAVSGGPYPCRSGRCVGGGGGPALGIEGQAGEPAIWQALHGVLTGGAQRKLEREAARARVALGAAVRSGADPRSGPQGSGGGCAETSHGAGARGPDGRGPGPRGRVLRRLALGRWGQAEAAFKEAVRRAPRDAEYLLDLRRAARSGTARGGASAAGGGGGAGR
jgi:hypothetical protein